MNESEVVDYIMKTFPKVETVIDYGYNMFFYSSDRKLSFATTISSDYDYDHISNLNRRGVFRLNIGVSKQLFNRYLAQMKSTMSKITISPLWM